MSITPLSNQANKNIVLKKVACIDLHCITISSNNNALNNQFSPVHRYMYNCTCKMLKNYIKIEVMHETYMQAGRHQQQNLHKSNKYLMTETT